LAGLNARCNIEVHLLGADFGVLKPVFKEEGVADVLQALLIATCHSQACEMSVKPALVETDLLLPWDMRSSPGTTYSCSTLHFQKCIQLYLDNNKAQKIPFHFSGNCTDDEKCVCFTLHLSPALVFGRAFSQ